MKLLLFLLLSFSALAADLKYLTQDSVNLNVVPTPPVVGSLEDQEDLDEVYNLQMVRTDEECRRAAIEAEGTSVAFFGSAYGPMNDLEAAKFHDFHETLYKEVKFFTRLLKKGYARVRPYNRDIRITPCIKLETSHSYPSGHTTAAFVTAEAYALLYPERSEAFYERARSIGNDRILGGVHHPLDVIAGRILGAEIFKALLLSKQFRQDLERLK